VSLIPPGFLDYLNAVLDLARKALEYEALLMQVKDLPRSPVYECEGCGRLKVRTRANRRKCEECAR